MKRNSLFLFSIIALFVSGVLCADSPLKNTHDYVYAELKYLPSWCDKSWLYEQEEGIVPLEAPSPSLDAGVGNGDSFFVRKTCDRGHMARIELVRDGRVEGTVMVAWNGENIEKVTVIDAENNEVLADYFSYNNCGFPISHTLEGILSGTAGKKEQYTTTFQYDSQGRMTSSSEQNGHTLVFLYEHENSYVVIDRTPTSSSRHRVLIDIEGTILEDLEDNGTSLDMDDIHGVTWRRWKRENVIQDESGLVKKITSVGGFSPEQSKEVLLRIEEQLWSQDGSLLSSAVYNAQKELISSSKGNAGLIVNSPSTPEEGYGCIDGLGHLTYSTSPDLPSTTRRYDLLGNMTSQEEGEVNPIFIEYTSRGQPFHVTYADGTQERMTYALDGQEISHLFRDGTLQVVDRDERGRLLTTTRFLPGATEKKETSYTYDGPYVRGWVVENTSCVFLRDFFGRVTGIYLSQDEKPVQEFSIDHDVCDRLVHAVARGEENWEWIRTYSRDGQEVRTSYQNEETEPNSVTTLERYHDGCLRYRKETFPDGQELEYTFDEKGLLKRAQHCLNGNWHEFVSIERGEKGNLQYETSFFPDHTSITEERTMLGRLSRRVWEQDGRKVLEEAIHVNPNTSSVTIRQEEETGRVRQFDWTFNEKKRLQAVFKNGKKAVEYAYDDVGHLVGKSTAGLRSIHYEWNSQNQVSRVFSDDQTVDYRFSYDEKGRVIEAEDAISSHKVIKNYDRNGQLIKDGEEGSVCSASYVDLVVHSIMLPDGSSIIYEGNTIRRESENPWSMTTEFRSARPLETIQPLCCRPSLVNFTDPLGSWTAQYSYDACNQLHDEQGEFTLDYRFDPFGSIQRLDGHTASYDLDQQTMQIGPYGGVFDDDHNMVVFTGGEEKLLLSYDALGRVCCVRSEGVEERYRYDAFDRLQEIITSYADGSEIHRRIIWLGEIELGSVVNNRLSELKIPHPQILTSPLAIEIDDRHYRVDCDNRGSITAVYDASTNDVLEVYRFSAFGQLHKYGPGQEELSAAPISPWLYCGKRWISCMQAYDFGARRYFPTLMRWLESDPFGMIDGVDDRMYVRNNPVLFSDPKGLWSWPIHWSTIKETGLKTWAQFKEKAYKSITFSKTVFDWVQEVRASFEELVFKTFDSLLISGRKNLHLMGYNLDRTSAGVYGEKERHPKVRISYINGILNGSHDINSSLDILYTTHGCTPIHYVYVATDGFSGDIVRGVCSKTGVITTQVKMLVSIWQSLIQEMGGVSGGGMVIHYAHSLGATDTATALQLLTPEERRCLRISTFGSPTLMQEQAELKIDNYVSEKDGVPKLDIIHYRRGRKGTQKNIHFLPSDSSLPFVDHYMSGKTYAGMLEILGQQFQEEFILEQ